MWINGLIDENKTFQTTFSEVLEINSKVQERYLIWWGFYCTTKLYTIFLLTKYTLKKSPKDISHPKAHYPYVFYFISTYLYSLFTTLSVFHLLFIYYNPVSANHVVHYMSASTAFATGIASCFMLQIRRTILAHYVPQIHANYGLFVFIWITLIAQLSMAICFITITQDDNIKGPKGGEYEFTLALLIVIDPLWLVYDFWNDKDPVSYFNLSMAPIYHHRRSHTPP